MNETEYVRGQLALQRAHLREIASAVHPGIAPRDHLRPAQLYLDWAGRRLLQQLTLHRTALLALPALPPALRAQLAQLASATAQLSDTTARAPHLHAQPLLGVLDAWSPALDELAGTALRLGHWRQAGHLSADTILEERELYAAARGVLGVS
jgi:hypothetical protein